jgi:hypothetical protein
MKLECANFLFFLVLFLESNSEQELKKERNLKQLEFLKKMKLCSKRMVE